MPSEKAVSRARRDARNGKSASTQAGEFVKDEIDRIRSGKHGARSTKQAIAIGLSEARRAGVKLKSPGKNSSTKTRRKAAQDTAAGARPHHRASGRRSRATLAALKREPRSTVSHAALSLQARNAAKRRGGAARKTSSKATGHTRTRARRGR